MISIKVKPTKITRLMVLLPHLLAMLVLLFLTPLMLMAKVGLVGLIVLSLFYFLRLHVTQNLHNSILQIRQDSKNNWLVTLFNRQGEATEQTLPLLSSSFVSVYLVILNFKGRKSGHCTALIPYDSMPKDDFRRLRVALKTHKKAINKTKK